MARLSKVSQEDGGEVRLGSSDPVLTLLDAKQWSYLKRRYDLTPRELEIADLVCRGLENDRIAEHLAIRPGTVKAHVRNIYRKVKVSSKIRMLLRFIREASDLTRSPGSASLRSLD